jgi:hypothetical protein
MEKIPPSKGIRKESKEQLEKEITGESVSGDFLRKGMQSMM